MNQKLSSIQILKSVPRVLTSDIIVTDANRHLFGGLLNEQFRMRHKLFVTRLGWDVPSTDHIETDQYDRADTVYILIESGGKLVAYARLLDCSRSVTYGPTTFSFMVQDAINGQMPSIPANIMPRADLDNIVSGWEMTRVEAADRTAFEALFCAAYSFLQSKGSSHAITFTRKSFCGILNGLGYQTRECGPRIKYGSKDYVVLVTDVHSA